MATGGIAASGASAAFEWEVAGSSMAAHGVSQESTTTSESPVTLTTSIGKVPIEVDCTISGSGSLRRGGSATELISLSACSSSDQPKCVIQAPLELKASASLLGAVGSLYRKFIPTETDFGLLKIRKCADEGNYTITGSFAGQEAPVAEVNHALSLSGEAGPATGAELFVGGVPANLVGTLRQSLTSGSIGSAWRGVVLEAAPAPILPTTALTWHVNGSALYGSTAVLVSGGPIDFNLTIAGSSVEVVCQTVNSTPGARIENIGSVGGFSGGFKFSGCAVPRPMGCAIAEESITTEPLTASLAADRENSSYLTYKPARELWFVMRVRNCGFEGNYSVRGSAFARSGVAGGERRTQPLEFGGNLELGANPVGISGTALEELVAGEAFGGF
ncbi:MAG TPA: hypothetical protein VGH14_04790 [Solirubrobacterales bacterium]